MLQDFKKFLLRGNIVELATAVVVGGAFGKIVNSMVKDIIMPPIGLAIGGVDFKDLKLVIQQAQDAVMNGETVAQAAVEEVAINYGNFIQITIEFVVIAFCIFLVLKAYEASKKKEEAPAPAAPPAPSAEEKLLTEIRDLLKKD